MLQIRLCHLASSSSGPIAPQAGAGDSSTRAGAVLVLLALWSASAHRAKENYTKAQPPPPMYTLRDLIANTYLLPHCICKQD
ncbi:uncharacterized protein PG998_011088 [Apiospora kogelbergensis]|uniref:Uncharacterized protein n=1 Tax=Apiospora kogelbergensis TaxID=1337665 RepID=A0AAW0RCV4_9PEZI